MINKEIFAFPIVYTTPDPRIALGWGAHQTIGDECKAAGMKKALIVTSGLRGTGIVEEIKGVIDHAGVVTEIFDKITSNPKDHEIMTAYKVFTEAQCDGVVAVGGGSSMDTAKCIRVIDANGGQEVTNFTVFLDPPFEETIRNMKPCTIPQISVATTAGTGAEVTSWAAISDTKARAKVLVIRDSCYCLQSFPYRTARWRTCSLCSFWAEVAKFCPVFPPGVCGHGDLFMDRLVHLGFHNHDFGIETSTDSG